MSVLNSAAGRINQRCETAGVYGFDITVILTVLPALIQLFQSCKRPPAPQPIPVPTPTPAQSKAWEMKCTATNGYDADDAEYDRALLRRTAATCKRARRKDGNPCNHKEALELARASLDEARLGELDELAAGIEEAGH